MPDDDLNPLPDHDPARNIIDPSVKGFAPTNPLGPRNGKPPGKGRKVKGSRKVTADFLANRTAFAARNGYSKPRYVEFCEAMMAHGYECFIHEAVKTHSKYISVRTGEKRFKVRFSNHKPIKGLEMQGSCDFFVGVTHTGTRTTAMAIDAAVAALGKSHWRADR